MSSKERPDYTKYMRKPAAIQMSPQSDTGDIGRGPIREEDIPWAEIIEVQEPGIQPEQAEPPAEPGGKPASTSPVGITHAPAAIGWEDQPAPPYLSFEPPPLPVLALALPLLLVLMI